MIWLAFKEQPSSAAFTQLTTQEVYITIYAALGIHPSAIFVKIALGRRGPFSLVLLSHEVHTVCVLWDSKSKLAQSSGEYHPTSKSIVLVVKMLQPHEREVTFMFPAVYRCPPLKCFILLNISGKSFSQPDWGGDWNNFHMCHCYGQSCIPGLELLFRQYSCWSH